MLLTDIYHPEQVTSVLFSPDSRYVLYCSDCNGATNYPQIGVHDINQATSRKALQPSESAGSAVRCFAISPDGRVVAVVQAHSDQTKIRLVDFESGEVLDCLIAQQPVQRVAFLPDGRSLLTVSSSQSVDIWQ